MPVQFRPRFSAFTPASVGVNAGLQAQNPHFGSANTDLPVALRKADIPDAAAFWQGKVYLSNQRGQVLPVEIQTVLPRDADEVHHWYFAEQGENPVYEDRKWHDWWVAKIRHPEPGTQLFKLTANGKILGVMMLETTLQSYHSRKPISLLRGIRIEPSQYGENKSLDSWKGIGTALITFAVANSLRHGNQGIGVNSSVGVEGYYVKLLGPSPCKSFDGVRDYFEITGDESTRFLEKTYRQYQALRNQRQ